MKSVVCLTLAMMLAAGPVLAQTSSLSDEELLTAVVNHSTTARDASSAAVDAFNNDDDTEGCRQLDIVESELEAAVSGLQDLHDRTTNDSQMTADDRASYLHDLEGTTEQVQGSLELAREKKSDRCE